MAIFKYLLVLPLKSKIKYSFSKMELIFSSSKSSVPTPQVYAGSTQELSMKSRSITQSRASLMCAEPSLTLGKHSKLSESP